MIPLTLGSSGQAIPAADVLSVVWRTDLVPVPTTVEFSVLDTPENTKALQVGEQVLVGVDLVPMVLVRVSPIKTQTILEGHRMGALRCIGIFSGCKPLIDPSPRAVINTGTSFLASVRALGASPKVGADIPLQQFVCLKGAMPTQALAHYLQREAAVFCLQDGRLNVVRIDGLFEQPPALVLDQSQFSGQDAPVKKSWLLADGFAIAEDGSTVEGGDGQGRTMRYMPRLTDREIRNMRRVLVHRGCMVRPLNLQMQAGQVVEVHGLGVLVVLTAAHHWRTGAMGGVPQAITKVWLSGLEK